MTVFPIYVYEKPKLNFQKHQRGSAFFETAKTVIIRKGGYVYGYQEGYLMLLKFLASKIIFGN